MQGKKTTSISLAFLTGTCFITTTLRVADTHSDLSNRGEKKTQTQNDLEKPTLLFIFHSEMRLLKVNSGHKYCATNLPLQMVINSIPR